MTMVRECCVCGDASDRPISIVDGDGATGEHACYSCLAKISSVNDCALCWDDATGEYGIVKDDEHWDRQETICGECRRTLIGSGSIELRGEKGKEGPECPECGGLMWTYKRILSDDEWEHTIACTSCEFAIDTVSNKVSRFGGGSR